MLKNTQTQLHNEHFNLKKVKNIKMTKKSSECKMDLSKMVSYHADYRGHRDKRLSGLGVVGT